MLRNYRRHLQRAAAILGIAGALTFGGLQPAVQAQSTTTPNDTSSLNTGVNTLTTLFNGVFTLVGASALAYAGVRIFKKIGKA